MTNDFSKGKVSRHIVRLAIPVIIAQVVNVLYSIVDRIYIGHMEGIGQMALTGIGLCLPITMTVSAFSALIGFGGAPLSSILRGAKDINQAEKVLGNCISALIFLGIAVPAICLAVKEPILYLFGASDATYGYANTYITIYLLGSLPVMLTLGLNPFINAQGFTRDGMITVAVGAVLNLILDPIFIFVFRMGIAGAAIATVISQSVSCLWVLMFFFGKKNMLRIRRANLRPEWPLLGKVCALGVSGFIMQITESALSAVFNANLQQFGGDIYVTAMTVASSLRQVAFLVIQGFGQGAQPVIGYNFGAKEYGRVRQSVRFLLLVSVIYSVSIWIALQIGMPWGIAIFNNDPELIEIATPLLRIYFMGTFIFGTQSACQNVFVALGEAKKSVFVALFRKVILLIPLIIILPRLGFGVLGIYSAEPIADIISATVCTILYMCTCNRSLKRMELAQMTREK